MQGNGRVFICHASEDNAHCEALCAALDAWEIDYFFDASSLKVGEHFPDRISREIADRDIFLRIATVAANKSAWVEIETNTVIQLWADERKNWQNSKRTLINLILDDTTDPLIVRANFHALDTRGTSRRVWLAELRRSLGLQANSDAGADRLDIHDSGWFTQESDTVWLCTNGTKIQGVFLTTYRSMAALGAYHGLTALGLPLEDEQALHVGVLRQRFERGTLVYDPDRR
jgi:hypothetical protein